MKTRISRAESPKTDDFRPDNTPDLTPSDVGTLVEVASLAEVEATMEYLLKKNAELYRKLAE